MPETFHARFPVSAEDMSACGRHPAKAPRRTRVKTSGTQGIAGAVSFQQSPQPHCDSYMTLCFFLFLRSLTYLFTNGRDVPKTRTRVNNTPCPIC